VESTARQGTGLGFAFVVVEDACGAMAVEEHAYAVKIIFPQLAKVRSTDEVIAALA
jgi:nicotinamidase-related amidase